MARIPDTIRSDLPGGRFQWATWRATLVLVAALTILRIVFLIWLCPFELAGDEAQYWDWSRHLDLSYYSKGPGVAWTIAASTAIFGTSEWSVRLPAVLFAAAGTIFMARLGMAVARGSRGDQRVGFFSAVAFNAFLGYQFTAMIMTIDGPHVACWAGVCWMAVRAFQQQRAGRRAWSWWLGLGLLLGVGFLFKYTVLLLAVGLLVYAVVDRRRLHWTAKALTGPALAAMVFLVLASPVFIWNAQHGWPTVAHLIGRLNLPGGDMHPAGGWVYSPKWMLQLLSDQVAILNLAGIVIAIGLLTAWRRRRDEPQTEPETLLLISAAAPILLFYFAASIAGKVQANWPLPGYMTLLVLVAQILVWWEGEAPAEPCVSGHPRLGRSLALTSPMARVFLWSWLGFVALGVILFAGTLLIRPILATPLGQMPLVIKAQQRVAGHRQWAAAVDHSAEVRQIATGRRPLIVTGYYQDTALLAFYLRGRPAVLSADAYLGRRKSSYDYFPDTSLNPAENPSLIGRDALLLGSPPELWRAALAFDAINLVDRDRKICLGLHYLGPRTPPPAIPATTAP